MGLVPTLTYGHELTLTLGDRVKSCVTQEELRVDLLHLHTKASQLRRPGHLCWMPHGCLQRVLSGALSPGGLGVPAEPAAAMEEEEWVDGQMFW